jgi:hypothetical protein
MDSWHLVLRLPVGGSICIHEQSLSKCEIMLDLHKQITAEMHPEGCLHAGSPGFTWLWHAEPPPQGQPAWVPGGQGLLCWWGSCRGLFLE